MLGLPLIIFKFILDFFKNRNKTQIKDIDESFYYRDIPCFGNIDLAYWLLYNFSNIKKKDLNSGLFNAYLLDWYKKGYIDIKNAQGFINNNYTIDLKDGNWEKSNTEKKIYSFLKNAARNNNILEKNEIREYCSVDGGKSKLDSIFKNTLYTVQEELRSKNYITIIEPKNYIFFKTQEKILLSETLINEYKNLNGLKNFLLNYSNMDEKTHVEVQIWEKYFIFANLLGIADNVKQQFHKIYPNLNNVNLTFDISLDSTIGQLNFVYSIFKQQYYIIAGTILLFLLPFLIGNLRLYAMLIVALYFIGSLYWFLKKYLTNKKVKETNTVTYAKITEVSVRYDRNSDGYRTYDFTYEYTVNGVNYKGYSYSNFKKRENRKIKIYYNQMNPSKSETSKEHNHYLKLFIYFIIVTFLIVFFALND